MDLVNSINKLKTKIKKIELLKKNDVPIFITNKIILHKELNDKKKFIALQFSDDYDKNDNNKSFIKLQKKYQIINYFITIKMDDYCKNNKDYCSFTLGIKENNIIKTIKSSKTYCLSTSIIDNHITISNTIIYSSSGNQELCLIAQLPLNCRNIIPDKSILQILSL
jgi:hypothetical protein